MMHWHSKHDAARQAQSSTNLVDQLDMFSDMRVGKAVLVSHRRTYVHWPLDEAVKSLETGEAWFNRVEPARKVRA
jgi:hypothetical protein